MIPQDTIEQILQRVSIVEVIGSRIQLKKSGQNYKGLCPFHNDRKNPSLSVSEEKGLYHCFSCGAGGNALTFLKEFDKLDFIDSIRELGKMAGIDIENYLTGTQDNILLRERLKTMHQLAQEYFIKQLYSRTLSAQKAVSIIKQRYLDKNTVKTFGLGFGGDKRDGLFQELRKQGFDPDEIIFSGLCGKTDQGRIYDRFQQRITFPVQEADSTIVAFGGRAILANASAKYINSPETPLFKKGNILYGWNFAKESATKNSQVILAEGYLDIIRLHQAGFCFAAAPLGTGLTEDHIIFLKHKVKEIILCFDGDNAGQKSAYRSAGLCAKFGIKTRVTALPENEDPDTFLLSNGTHAFKQLLETSVLGEDFVLETASALLPDSIAFLNSVFEYGIQLDGAILTEQFLKKIAEKAAVSLASVELEFSRFRKNYERFSPDQKPESPKKNLTNAHELIAILINYPQFADDAAEIITPQDFADPEYEQIFRNILLNPEKTAEYWIRQVGHSNLIQEVAKVTSIPDMRIIKNHAVQIRLKSLENQSAKLSQEILKSEQTETNNYALIEKIKELQSEKIALKNTFYHL